MPPLSDDEGNNSMQNVVNLFSCLLAVSQAQTICPIREDRDGSCTGQQTVYQPLNTDKPAAAAIRDPRPRQMDADVVVTMLAGSQNRTQVHSNTPRLTPVKL